MRSRFHSIFLTLFLHALIVCSITIAETTATKALSDSKTIPEMIGELVPYRKVLLAPKVNGRLIEVSLFSGDLASEGTVIAIIDPRDFELNVAQANGALEALKAKLKLLERGARPEERKQAEEAVRQSKANMENAKSELMRVLELFTAGAVSKQALESSDAKRIVTLAQYDAAIQQKALVDQGPRTEEKDAIRAQIRQQEAVLKLAKLQLEYSRLRAPFSGVVAIRQADEGAYVTSSTPVYNFIQIDPVFAVAECPEQSFRHLKPGMKAIISIDALPGKIFQGTLLRLPSFLESKTRTAHIEITVPNPEFELKPGMFARITFE